MHHTHTCELRTLHHDECYMTQVILQLFAYKCLYPKHFHLNRGNHETINMNKMYGFEGEVAAKYSKDMMRLFTDIFQW